MKVSNYIVILKTHDFVNEHKLLFLSSFVYDMCMQFIVVYQYATMLLCIRLGCDVKP